MLGFHSEADCRPPVQETREGGLGGDASDLRQQALIGDDLDMLGTMIATQDSFRRQLADLRENLNKVNSMSPVRGRNVFHKSFNMMDIQ